MLRAIKRFTTWITITSLVALGMGGVVAKATTQPLPHMVLTPQGTWVPTPTVDLPDWEYVSEADGAVTLKADWSTVGIRAITTLTLSVATSPDGPPPTLTSDYLYARFMPSGNTYLNLAANSSGQLTIRIPVVNDKVLEPDEMFDLKVWGDTAQTRLAATTTLTIEDDETYSDGLVGVAGLGTTSTTALMNAYTLATISDDIYLNADESLVSEEEGAATAESVWATRFENDYSSAEYGWKNVKTYDQTIGDTIDTQAATMTNSSAFVIAFRGTQQSQDGLTDGFAVTKQVPGTSPKVYVHTGFWDALEPVYSSIINELKLRKGSRVVWITGHSLGGALAQLMAYRIKMSTDPVVNSSIVRVVTFGAPMVGQTAFDNALNSYSFRSLVGPTNMQRWVNLQDPVPQVPGLTAAGWKHNSDTTLLKEVAGAPQVFPGSPMPVVTDTGVSFGDHSLELYGQRIRTITAAKMGITDDEFDYFAAPLYLVPEAPPMDPNDEALIATLVALGLTVDAALFAGFIVTTAVVIGLAIFVVAELLLALDYVWNEIAPVLEAGYQATAEEFATLMNDLGMGIDEIAAALHDVFATTAAEAADILNALGATYDQIATALSDAFGLAYSSIASALKAIGASAEDAVDAIMTAFGELDYSSVGAFLTSAGYALSAVADALYSLFDVTVNQIAKVFKDLGKAAADVAKALVNGIGATAAEIASALKNIFLSTAAAAAAIFKTLGIVLADIVLLLKTVFSATADVVAAALKAVGAVASQIATLLKNVFGAAISAIATAIKNAFLWAADKATELATALKTAFGAAYDSIASAVKTALSVTANALATTIKAIGATISQAASALKAAFGSAFDSIATALKTAYTATASAVASAIKAIGASINQAAAALKSAFGAAYDTIASAVKAAYSAAASTVATAIKAIGASINQAAAALKSAFGAAYDTIAAAVKSAYSATASALASALKSISAGFSAIASAIFSLFSAGWDMLYDLLVAIGASVSEVLSILWDLF